MYTVRHAVSKIGFMILLSSVTLDNRIVEPVVINEPIIEERIVYRDSPIVATQLYKPVEPVCKKLPIVYNRSWGGNIDLETYRNDNCFCPMCVEIRKLQKTLREQYDREYEIAFRAYQIELNSYNLNTATQQATPDNVIDQALNLMELGQNDVLADYGCGDARVLIRAAKLYGCKCIGIEIDEDKAKIAAQNVKDEGLENLITIINSDVESFDPIENNVTAIYAYLYPELLNKLVDHFRAVKTIAIPYHLVDGIELVNINGIYVKK